MKKRLFCFAILLGCFAVIPLSHTAFARHHEGVCQRGCTSTFEDCLDRGSGPIVLCVEDLRNCLARCRDGDAGGGDDDGGDDGGGR